MTTAEAHPYSELAWESAWDDIRQQRPQVRKEYLDKHYGGKVPSYEEVEFHSADSIIAFRLHTDGTYEAFPYSGTTGGLIRIMEKGLLLVRPDGGQPSGRRTEVESPVATAEQPGGVSQKPETEAALPELPQFPLPEDVQCPECPLHPRSPGRYRRHMLKRHDIEMTRLEAQEYWDTNKTELVAAG